MIFPAKPTALLLATDLSARSDRAQARAIQLARQWQASLVVVIAHSTDGEFGKSNAYHDADASADAPAPESPAAYIQRLAQQTLADADVPLMIHVVDEAPGPAAARIAQEYACGLIVTGTSRSEVAMRMDPGSTLRWLVRHAKRPVLAVHDRVQAAYRNVTVASDFSNPATQALQLANAWFDSASLRTLLHAYEIPLSTLARNDGPRETSLQSLQEQATQQAQAYLLQTLGEAAATWQPVMQAGGPVRLLREHARSTQTQLTVIATHGRSALRDRLLGSVADRLLETVGTDLLVVPPAL
ncbi:MAG: universal stress protein [Lysobacterales bacterium]|nr:universal stress protein [Xanthomonadaceae bacterium]